MRTPAIPILQSDQIATGADALDIATIHVESYLVGNSCSPRATPIVEEVLFNHALKHAIVYAGRGIKEQLQSQGLSVTLQYCNSSVHGHPVPFLVARDVSGAFIIPKELDSTEQTGEFELVVVDGTEKFTRIVPKRLRLATYATTGVEKHHCPTELKRRRRIAVSRNQHPTAIIVLPKRAAG